MAEYDQPLVSHLVHFSDAEGLYLPVDFPEPLIAGPGGSAIGGAVGSSAALRRDLVELAPALGGEQHSKHHPFGTERMLWLIVFGAATQSLAHPARSAL